VALPHPFEARNFRCEERGLGYSLKGVQSGR